MVLKRIKKGIGFVVIKLLVNNIVYKYAPRLFLWIRFRAKENINTESYWSSVHTREAEESHHRFDHAVRELLPKVDFTDKDVLDVGCGRGMFLSKIPEARSRTGVDITPTAISEVQKQGMAGHVRTLPYLELPSTYDVVTSFETLEHTMHWKRSLGEMLKVLRDGGYLIISVPFEDGILISEHVTYFDLPRLYRCLRSKVSIAEIKILGPWILVIAQKKKYKRGVVYDYFAGTGLS